MITSYITAAATATAIVVVVSYALGLSTTFPWMDWCRYAITVEIVMQHFIIDIVIHSND